MDDAVESDSGSPEAGSFRSAPSNTSFDDVRLLVYCSVDTHVKTLAPVIRRFKHYRILAPVLEDGGVRAALDREKLCWEDHSAAPGAFRWANVGICACDWGYEERWFVAQCRSLGAPTLCLQEGTNVDFGPYPYRMEYADAVCLQGAYALKYLDRDLAFLTGNPRYDTYESIPAPPRETVLINSNFLFNQGHDRGRAWVDEVIAAVNDLGLDYFISVHPRDSSDLSGLENVAPSGAYAVADQLRDCSMVVSRDSSLPYEALLCNRHAIYFNPFDERERYLNEDEYGLIRKTHARKELTNAIRGCARLKGPREDEEHSTTLEAYFGPLDGEACHRVARAIATVALLDKDLLPRDARSDRAAVARMKTDFMRWARPRVKEYPRLRAAWRRVRTSVHPPRY